MIYVSRKFIAQNKMFFFKLSKITKNEIQSQYPHFTS